MIARRRPQRDSLVSWDRCTLGKPWKGVQKKKFFAPIAQWFYGAIGLLVSAITKTGDPRNKMFAGTSLQAYPLHGRRRQIDEKVFG